MKDKYSKEEILELIKKARTPEDIKKIKRKAMHSKIKLKELRRLFCKKCYKIFNSKDKVRIKNKFKVIECGKCGFKNIWKIS